MEVYEIAADKRITEEIRLYREPHIVVTGLLAYREHLKKRK